MRTNLLGVLFVSAGVALQPSAKLLPSCENGGVTYKGIHLEGVEAFLGIRFAADASGSNRFKPPVPYVPRTGDTIVANDPGPSCIQDKISLGLSYEHKTSEDCLRLNIWRPNGTESGAGLPVLTYIYGGGFSSGTKDELWPGEMIQQSVLNGHPIIHVELNYRVGIFGFAQNDALKAEGAENIGLRDQRFALEWVSENIAAFGGDPGKVTIHGQSSGGLAVGMQIMAYGGAKPVPFQQGICESQALEPRITSRLTRDTMIKTWQATSCNHTSFDSAATIECLRSLSAKELLMAQDSASSQSPSNNIGDQWLPAVDGDFLPDAPSTLIYEKRFASVTTMIGWCEDDAMLFTPYTIKTPADTATFISEYLPALTKAHLKTLLSLYPSDEFSATFFPNGTLERAAQQYRVGRILRDILFTCQPIFYGQAIAALGSNVYFYNQNQSTLTDLFASLGYVGDGVFHGSEQPYVFGNLTIFPGLSDTPSDIKLRNRETRSWSTFTALGQPSLAGHDTLPGWLPADFTDENYGTYVIGGPNEGDSGPSRPASNARIAMAKQRLAERCGFLTSPSIVKEEQF